MFPRLSCVYMHLEMCAEVKVHAYHAHAHVCVGSYMCCAQATPLSKLQLGTIIIPYIGVAYTRGGGVPEHGVGFMVDLCFGNTEHYQHRHRANKPGIPTRARSTNAPEFAKVH